MVIKNFKKETYILSFALSTILIFGLVMASTSVNSPSSCSGQWTSCSNAFANDANRATASVSGTANKSGVWNNYGLSLADSDNIDSVIVRADFFASKSSGYINVKVSGDGGATYGVSHVVGGNTAEQTYNIDITSDLSWSANKLNNSNFIVNVTCFKQGGGANPICNLDWIPANVSYTPFNFVVSVSPNNGTVNRSVNPGNNISSNVNVLLLSGNASVSLSQTGCPAFATCSFSPVAGVPTFNSTFTMSVNVTTPVGTYPINITGTGDGKTSKTVYTLSVTA